MDFGIIRGKSAFAKARARARHSRVVHMGVRTAASLFPVDASIPGLLSAAEFRDVVAALYGNRIEVIAEDLRDCSNRTLEQVQKEWGTDTPQLYMTFPTHRATESLKRNLMR